MYDAATGNYVQGNHIGTDLGGTHSLETRRTALHQQRISNVIGNDGVRAQRHLQRQQQCLRLRAGATSDVIQNNIGTDTAGTGESEQQRRRPRRRILSGTSIEEQRKAPATSSPTIGRWRDGRP
jgi:hypothetical protein